MTSSPNSRESASVLEAAIHAAPAADPQWQEQLDRLRNIASYDLVGVQMLQTLLDVARAHGTEVRLTPVAVPATWNGPVLQRGPDMAPLLGAQADRGRRLGQLPLA